ncbi:glycosyltransferase family 4 protein, partial [Candidatus Aminicenantes bacterium AH-873-B07]|nr:glycosyltransferase family 4 protein [Candidatus Aminicenantes bacterium AH-873-B07]
FEVFRSKILIPFTAKKADKVITGSNFSKNDIISNYKINSQKIEVIPYGVSSSFKPIKNEEKIKKVLKKYTVTGEYILTVGRLNPRKNLLSLVKAYNILKKNKKIPHKLVIVGKEDYNSKETIQFIKKMDCYKDIIFTGFAKDEDLPYLYNGADIFVYPSLFEGVGLPVLEAMSCGVPVITSNTTALKEIIGNAGIAINPFNIDEIAQAIFQIISNEDLKNVYIKKAFERAKEFSWKLTAQRTLKIYKVLLKYY